MLPLQFILANLTRSRARAVFTVGTVIVAFLLFGLLLSLERVFNAGVTVTDADRLIVANKSSIMQTVPLGYGPRIAKLDNVDLIAPFVFLGTFFQDPNQQVVTIATEPRAFSSMIHEMDFRDPAQREGWFNDRASIAVGRAMADKYGWQVGDLVPLYSVIYPKASGGNVWTMRVAAIFDAKKKDGNTKSVAMHLDYFDELRMHGQGTVGWYNVRVKDARKSQATSRAIEALFANSPAEVKAGTEAAFTEEFMRQVGDFGLMISLALAAVFFTLALVAANTMAQAVNERRSELAVLKTIGFSNLRLFLLVYGEGLAMALAGGLAGMALAAGVTPFVAERSHLLANMKFQWSDLEYALLAMFVVATVSTLLPALRAMRVNVVGALERTA